MKKILLSLVALLALFVFSGCLDIVEAIGVKPDGSGQIATAVRGDNDLMTREQLSSMAPILDAENVSRSYDVMNGAPVRLETAEFGSLGDFSSALGPYEINRNADGTMTLTHVILGEEEYDSELDSMTIYFNKRNYTFSALVPGSIVDAPAVKVLGRPYYPERDGSEVSWTIPMDQFVKAVNMGKSITFSATYRPY